MYYIYNGNDSIVDEDGSPIGAELKRKELERNGDYDARVEKDEGGR